MRCILSFCALLFSFGMPAFAESPATEKGAVAPELTEDGAESEATEEPQTETRRFVITKGAKLFSYVKFVAGKEQSAIFPVLISKSVAPQHNALFLLFDRGSCPGSFTIGEKNQGSFRFVCRNRFHGIGQLFLDPATQRISGRGLINERDEFEFKE